MIEPAESPKEPVGTETATTAFSFLIFGALVSTDFFVLVAETALRVSPVFSVCLLKPQSGPTFQKARYQPALRAGWRAVLHWSQPR